MTDHPQAGRIPFHFCFLNWSSWSKRKPITRTRLPRLGEESAITGGAPITVTNEAQERACVVCGKEQVRFA